MQRRAAAPVQALQRRQLHRGDAGDAVLPDRRDEVRQADHRPRGQAFDDADRAAKCVLISFDSTMRSNMSVGLPIDLRDVHARCLRLQMQRRITETDPYFTMIHHAVGRGAAARVRPAARIPTGKTRRSDRGRRRIAPRSFPLPAFAMTIRIALQHRTLYAFDRPVGLSPHEVRLRPAPHCRTPIASYSLRVAPEKHFVNWQQDAYGNCVARFVFPEPARALDITVDLVADMTVINPFDFFVERWAEQFPFDYPPQLAAELAPYFEREPSGPLLERWLADFRRQGSGPAPTSSTCWCALNLRLAAAGEVPRAHGPRGADRPTRRSRSPRARAAIPGGSWCRSSAISGSRRASSRAISSSSSRT